MKNFVRFLELVAKLRCPEKSMILRPFARAALAAWTLLMSPTPRGLAKRKGRKRPQKGGFNGYPSFATSSLVCLCLASSAYAEKKTICLNMIVKNESKVIQRCLASVKPLIDYWVIVDTGSSDGTQKTIQDFMQDIPGELHERKWVDFEHNRNEALALAKNRADYLLFIDADEKLIFSGILEKSKLDKDYYVVNVQQADGLRYLRTLMVSNLLDWKWEGVIHECITCEKAKNFELLKEVVNFSNTEDGARSQDPKKYTKDAEILEKALLKDPVNSRYIFYLAQSYANAGEYALALSNYQKRSVMGGCDQEVFWSLYCIGRLQQILRTPQEEILASFWKAFQFRPSRVEPLFHLIGYYFHSGNFILGYILSKYALEIPMPNDIFVDTRIYNYSLLVQFIDCAYHLEKYEEAYQATAQLLTNSHLPSEERERLEKNLGIIKSKARSACE